MVLLQVLGDVSVDGAVVSRPRERDLLALLVAARGPVPAERILEELWSGEPSRAAMQVVVSRVRALLAGRGEAGIERTPAGYRLVGVQVDAWEFEDAAECTLAVPTSAERLVAATRADELWTGTPYAGSDSSSLHAAAARLQDLMLAVQEARAESLLALGHAAAAERLLAPVTPSHPYREQLWALLARAQYACSRQADALATLAALRDRLSMDLGVDPSPLVRSLEHRILVQDSELGGLGAAAGSAVRASDAPHRRAWTRHCRAGARGDVLGTRLPRLQDARSL